MQWNGKEVAGLSDTELIAANQSVDDMYAKYEERKQHPKFVERFKNQPPPMMNENFVNLRNEITTELSKRKLKV